MTYSSNEGLTRATSTEYHLLPIKHWLLNPEVTEICINRPYEVFIEYSSGVWEPFQVDALSFEHLHSLATAIARYAGQDVSDTRPILSADLPQGERIQIVLPPACEAGTLSITIRKPSVQIFDFKDYEQSGFFSHVKPLTSELTPDEALLLSLKEKGDYSTFLKKAVELEKVVVVAGATGSGKTTFMKTLVKAIPSNKRIITIEDTKELILPNHPNRVHLFYPSESQEGKDNWVNSSTLLRSCLRMKPNFILLAEVRGAATYDFINAALTGHPGITSCHASSCELTFERLALMMLESEKGRALPYDILLKILYQVVDVVLHIHNFQGEIGRAITQIWYDPYKKRGVCQERKVYAVR